MRKASNPVRSTYPHLCNACVYQSDSSRLEDESGVFEVEGGHPGVEGRPPRRVEAPRGEGEVASHGACVRRSEGGRKDVHRLMVDGC